MEEESGRTKSSRLHQGDHHCDKGAPFHRPVRPPGGRVAAWRAWSPQRSKCTRDAEKRRKKVPGMDTPYQTRIWRRLGRPVASACDLWLACSQNCHICRRNSWCQVSCAQCACLWPLPYTGHRQHIHRSGRGKGGGAGLCVSSFPVSVVLCDLHALSMFSSGRVVGPPGRRCPGVSCGSVVVCPGAQGVVRWATPQSWPVFVPSHALSLPGGVSDVGHGPRPHFLWWGVRPAGAWGGVGGGGGLALGLTSPSWWNQSWFYNPF